MPHVFYTLQKIPMMTLRESLMKMTTKKMEDGKNSELFISSSFSDPKYPRGNHAIRTSIFKGTMVTPRDDGINIHEYAQVNMGGMFPISLLNMFMSSIISKKIGPIHKMMLER
jgi:hypothetical protein